MTMEKFDKIKEEIVSIDLKPFWSFYLGTAQLIIIFHFSRGDSYPRNVFFQGTRLRRLPSLLRQCERVLVTSWGHDPAVVPLSNLLFALNDALTYSPVLAQVSDIMLNIFPWPKLLLSSIFEFNNGKQFWLLILLYLPITKLLDSFACGFLQNYSYFFEKIYSS